jgi:putative hydrolase of the HAD superfamily
VTAAYPMAVRAMLWDADGVLQGLPAGWEASMRPAVGHLVDDVEGFLAEAFAAEKATLTGQARWVDVLRDLMRRWDIEDAYEDALAVWLTIEPVVESRELLEKVRASGVPCYLATNQDIRRGTYMHENLGYADILDGAFYSYELGLAKPDPAYFEEIARRLSLPVGDVLFVDDNLVNVESARSVGMRAEKWHLDDGVDALGEVLGRHGLLAAG